MSPLFGQRNAPRLDQEAIAEPIYYYSERGKIKDLSMRTHSAEVPGTNIEVRSVAEAYIRTLKVPILDEDYWSTGAIAASNPPVLSISSRVRGWVPERSDT